MGLRELQASQRNLGPAGVIPVLHGLWAVLRSVRGLYSTMPNAEGRDDTPIPNELLGVPA